MPAHEVNFDPPSPEPLPGAPAAAAAAAATRRRPLTERHRAPQNATDDRPSGGMGLAPGPLAAHQAPAPASVARFSRHVTSRPRYSVHRTVSNAPAPRLPVSLSPSLRAPRVHDEGSDSALWLSGSGSFL
ncbi:hypothetical protein E4U54_006825, partial [Claviceps lovelessii]